METLQYIIFRVGEQRYGMSLMSVNGIEKDYHRMPVSDAPEGISGIVDLRGSIVPVYSLRERFGMERCNDDSDSYLLITRSAETILAYEVDEVEEIEEMPLSEVKQMPAVALNAETAFMEQVLHIKNDIVIVINADKVLSKEMIHKVNQLIQDNQQ